MRSLMIFLVVALAFVTFLRDLEAAGTAEPPAQSESRTQLDSSLLP